ncbi:hypothetical protein L1887_19860 [Cichorium endivia]|nr:hypothetical protein L1887_19860 [Cichorium endivia]
MEDNTRNSKVERKCTLARRRIPLSLFTTRYTRAATTIEQTNGQQNHAVRLRAKILIATSYNSVIISQFCHR